MAGASSRWTGYLSVAGLLAALSALRLAGFEGPSPGVVLSALWFAIVLRLGLPVLLSLGLAIPPSVALLRLGPSPWEADLLVASAGALAAHLVAAVAPRARAGPLALFGAGLLMWLLALLHFPPPPLTTLAALGLALGLGMGARRLELIEDTGVYSGALVGLLLIVFADARSTELPSTAGLRWFAFLLAFFVLGATFTRFRHSVKAALGVAQKRRDFRNVLGNGLGPVAMAVGYGLYGPPFNAGFLGAITTVTADTMATEVGMTQKVHPRLIHNLCVVPPGTSGAISLLGEATALATCLAMGLLALALGLASPAGVLAPALGGFVGTHVDSLLGATVEKRWRMSNHGVNMLASLAGAAAAMAIAGGF